MGQFGSGSFDNDSAMDIAYKLINWELINETLKNVRNGSQSFYWGHEALQVIAIAETVYQVSKLTSAFLPDNEETVHDLISELKIIEKGYIGDVPWCTTPHGKRCIKNVQKLIKRLTEICEILH